MNVALWIDQVLLAGLFLFAGVAKLVMMAEQMAGPVALPLCFLRFIGVCEAACGLGLILPPLLRVATWLTPLAAAGLVIIMIGAAAISLKVGVAAAHIPLVIALVAAFVAYGRWRPAGHQP